MNNRTLQPVVNVQAVELLAFAACRTPALDGSCIESQAYLLQRIISLDKPGLDTIKGRLCLCT